MASTPVECCFLRTARGMLHMRERDVPKRLWDEVLDLIIPLDHKAKGWELTGPLSDGRQGLMVL